VRLADDASPGRYLSVPERQRMAHARHENERACSPERRKVAAVDGRLVVTGGPTSIEVTLPCGS